MMMLGGQAHRGIALIQALVILNVLSLIALGMSVSARDSLVRAQHMGEAMRQITELHSARARILLALSQRYRGVDHDIRSNLESNWNFHGAEFNLGSGITARIYDASGLLALPVSDESPEIIAAFKSSGLDPIASRELQRKIFQAQRVDMSGDQIWHRPFQSLDEVRALLEQDAPEFLAEYGGYLTLLPVLHGDPLATPDALLSLRLDETASESLRQLRSQTGGIVEHTTFQALVQSLPEWNDRAYGPVFVLCLQAETGPEVAQVTVLELIPLVDPPLTLYSEAWIDRARLCAFSTDTQVNMSARR